MSPRYKSSETLQCETGLHDVMQKTVYYAALIALEKLTLYSTPGCLRMSVVFIVYKYHSYCVLSVYLFDIDHNNFQIKNLKIILQMEVL
jgi:hypothetical protein